MSEQENVRLVQQCYAAFQRGDIQAILNNLTDDVEWIEPPVEPLGGVYKGREGVGNFFKKVNETSEFSHFEPGEYVAQGDRVIVLGHYTATVKGSGAAYDADWAMAFTVRNGKISRFQEFTDTAAFSTAVQARSAAGA